MTRQQMIDAILQSVLADANLLILLRGSVNRNIYNVPDDQLQVIMTLLGLPTS